MTLHTYRNLIGFSLVALALLGASCAAQFPAGVGKATPVSFQLVMLGDVNFKPGYDAPSQYGVIRGQSELQRLWENVVTLDVKEKSLKQPPLPGIDFDKNLVIWTTPNNTKFANVVLKDVSEYNNVIQVTVAGWNSDFYGTNSVNFWTIPRTNKQIKFIETAPESETPRGYKSK